jgi:hypothetical protein
MPTCLLENLRGNAIHNLRFSRRLRCPRSQIEPGQGFVVGGPLRGRLARQKRVSIRHRSVAGLFRMARDFTGRAAVRSPTLGQHQLECYGKCPMNLAPPRRADSRPDDVRDDRMGAAINAVLLDHEVPLAEA